MSADHLDRLLPLDRGIYEAVLTASRETEDAYFPVTIRSYVSVGLAEVLREAGFELIPAAANVPGAYRSGANFGLDARNTAWFRRLPMPRPTQAPRTYTVEELYQLGASMPSIMPADARPAFKREVAEKIASALGLPLEPKGSVLPERVTTHGNPDEPGLIAVYPAGSPPGAEPIGLSTATDTGKLYALEAARRFNAVAAAIDYVERTAVWASSEGARATVKLEAVLGLLREGGKP